MCNVCAIRVSRNGMTLTHCSFLTGTQGSCRSARRLSDDRQTQTRVNRMGVTHLCGRPSISCEPFKEPMASSSGCKYKNSNTFLCHGLRLMPGAQNTSLRFHDDSKKRERMARPKSMVLVSCSSLRRSVPTAVRGLCAVAPFNHNQTPHESHQCMSTTWVIWHTR